MEIRSSTLNSSCQVLVIRGAPAVGKTTVSRAVQNCCLERGLACARLAWDDFFHMVEPAELTDADILATTHAMVAAATALMTRRVDLLILDGVFVLPKELAFVETLPAARITSVRLVCDSTTQSHRNRTRSEEDRLPDERLHEVAGMPDWATGRRDTCIIDTSGATPQDVVARILEMVLP